MIFTDRAFIRLYMQRKNKEMCNMQAPKEMYQNYVADYKGPDDDSHWQMGKDYFIRSVTHHIMGTLVKVTKQELVLINASWIADDGRFNEFLKTGQAREVEPFPDNEPVIVGRGALIDAVRWRHPLLRDVK